MSPAVRQTLTTLVQRLAATKGVTALVLRETVSPGYNRHNGSHYGVQGDPLGYTPLLRLAFLRRSHVDPLDLEPESYEGQMTANLSLPEFEDWQAMGSVAEDWNVFRAGADLDLLQTLLSTAQQSAGHRVPFLIKQRRTTWRGNWYGLWDDPRAKLPALSEEWLTAAPARTRTMLRSRTRSPGQTSMNWNGGRRSRKMVWFRPFSR